MDLSATSELRWVGECQLALGSCEAIGEIEFDEGLEVVLVIGTGDNSPTIAVEWNIGGVFADVGHGAGADYLLNMIAGNEVIGSLCWSSCREGSG